MGSVEVLGAQTPQPQPKAEAMVAVASSRAAQEVQAAMIVAKHSPRDENAAYSRIMQACQRKTLAEKAVYAYPRGGETVSGPSIRLAETLARSWGNLETGIIELEQRNGESTMMAYAWDLETNVRSTKVFQVKHQRHTKRGSTALSDPRDIYELTANQGARRLRACILSVIPGDVVEAALERCERTLAEGHTEPLGDRVRKMVAAFGSIGVSADMIERKLGHKLATVSEAELVQLRAVWNAIKDNMQPVDAYFDRGAAAPMGTADLAAKLQSEKVEKDMSPVERAAREKAEREAQPADGGAMFGDGDSFGDPEGAQS